MAFTRLVVCPCREKDPTFGELDEDADVLQSGWSFEEWRILNAPSFEAGTLNTAYQVAPSR